MARKILLLDEIVLLMKNNKSFSVNKHDIFLQNAFAKCINFCKLIGFWKMLQKLGNTFHNKTDAGYKRRPVIDHLNLKFTTIIF